MFASSKNKSESIQSNLEIGEPDDKYEWEADRVADAVMRMLDSGAKMQTNKGSRQLQMRPTRKDLQMKQNPSGLHQMCPRCQDRFRQGKPIDCPECSKKMQMKPGNKKSQTATSEIARQLETSKGSGNPLPSRVQREMSDKIGADFGNVNIHTGSKAIQMNQALGARAFTHGRDIYFNRGQYNPGSSGGKYLLAHELTHVIQQRTGSDKNLLQRDREDNTATDSTSSSLVDTVLPTGSGFYFDILAGVTWGIPVYTGGRVRGEIYRQSDETIVLIIYKQGRVGGDTGAGAGFYIGTPRRGRSGSSSSAGVGGEVGGHAETGLQVSVIEQYNLPVDEFLAALTATAGDQALSVMNLTPATAPFAMTVDNFLQEFAERYLVRTNYEFGLYASVAGEVTVGPRRPTEHAGDVEGGERSPSRTQGTEGWTRGERRNPSEVPRATDLDPMALLNLLRVVYTARVSGEVMFGVDLDKRGDKEVVKLYAEGQLQALLDLPIPFLSDIINMLPGEAGLGVELLFEFENDKISGVELNVYQFSGEDELYQGSANKQTMTVNLLNILDVEQILQSLMSGQVPNLQQSTNFDIQNMLETTEYWQRFSLFGPIGLRFNSFLRRQHGTRSLLSDRITQRSAALGLRFEPYFTIKFNMPADDFLRIAKMIPAAAKAGKQAIAEEDDLIDKIRRLGAFLSDYEDPELVALVEEILDSAVVSVAELRILFGGGVGVSGKLAKGAKVRGDLAVEGGAFCGKDLLEGEERNLREVLEILYDILDEPPEYLPECPFIHKLYNAGGEGSSDQESEESELTQSPGTGNTTSANGESAQGQTVESESADSSSSESLQVSSNYPEGAPPLTFPILNVYGPLTLETPENTELELDFIIYVEHAQSIVRVPVNVIVIDNTDTQIKLEVTEPWWINELSIGSNEGEIYTLNKPD